MFTVDKLFADELQINKDHLEENSLDFCQAY